MMTFKDLKVGDIIYYYDHGQVRGQIINSIRYVPRYEEYYVMDEDDPDHDTRTIEHKFWVIKTDRSSLLFDEYKYRKTIAKINSSLRFADYDAVVKYMDDIDKKRYIRYERAKKKLEKLQKIIKKYEQKIQEEQEVY